MLPSLLADENFNGRILRGPVRRVPELDVVRVQDVPEIFTAKDPVILEWAAAENRIILSHDISTMASFAYERIQAGRPMPGVFQVSAAMPVGQAIEELELIVRAGRAGEWKGQVRFLPL